MKKRLLLLLMSALVLMSSLTVYADGLVTENSEVEEVLSNYPEFPTSFVATDDGSTYIINNYILSSANGYTCLYCYVSSDIYTYYTSSDQIATIVRSSVSSGSDRIARYDLNGSTWKKYNDWHLGSAESSSYSSSFIYCSMPIYSNYQGEELVFQPAPLLSVAGLTSNQMSQMTMKQILCLVPLVISLLVFSTGLRKALQMLRQVLVQA